MNCGGNSFIWILLICMLSQGGCGNGCGCGGGCDSSMLILLLFIIMFSNGGMGCGICEAK